MSIFHDSIPTKIERIMEWLLDTDSKNILILYGGPQAGKSMAFWEAIERIRKMDLGTESRPCEIFLVQAGSTYTAYKTDEDDTDHGSPKTIIILTSPTVPEGMADLLDADIMLFTYEP